MDEVTIRYLENAHRNIAGTRSRALHGRRHRALAYKLRRSLIRMRLYAARITLDLSQVTPHVSGPDTVQTMQSLAEIEKKKIAIQKAYLVSCVNSRLEDLEAAAWVLCGKKVAAGVKFYVGAASAWVQEEAENVVASGKRLLDAGRDSASAELRPLHRAGNGTSGKRRGRHLRHQPQLQRPHGIARRAMLSRQSRSGGGIRNRRLHLRPAALSRSQTRASTTRN